MACQNLNNMDLGLNDRFVNPNNHAAYIKEPNKPIMDYSYVLRIDSTIEVNYLSFGNENSKRNFLFSSWIYREDSLGWEMISMYSHSGSS